MSFKGFLNHIFSQKDASSRETPVNWNEKRKHNRVEFKDNQGLFVHLLSPEGAGSARTLGATVRNLSVRGCWLNFPSSVDRDRLNVGGEFVATLAVDDFPIPLHVEVIRLIGDTEAAIRFKPPFPRELEKLERFLEPHCLGMSLREIDQASLQNVKETGMRWFQGVNETNLFSWTDVQTKDIVQQQLLFLGNVVEWTKTNPLRTGRIRGEEPSLSPTVGWIKAELLEFHAAPEEKLILHAKTILEASGVSADVRNIFLNKLKKR